MACHTLSESARMANVSRRTIQRYIKSGKLSYKNNSKGNPEVETSELIRVFGNVSHPEKETVSHPVTVTKTEIIEIINAATAPLIKQIEELKNEVQSLRLIEHKKSITETLKSENTEPKKPSNSGLDDIPDLNDYFNEKNNK